MEDQDLFIEEAQRLVLGELAEQVDAEEISTYDALEQAFILGQMTPPPTFDEATDVLKEWERDTRGES